MLALALALLQAGGLSGPPVLPEPSTEPGTEPPLAIVLEWTAPDTCPTTDDVRAAIAALLARRVDLDPTASVIARGEIERTSTGFRLRLEVDMAEGALGTGGAETRELDNERCDVLGEAAALIVATGIDPARVAARVHEQEIAAKAPKAVTPEITTQRDETPADPVATPPAGSTPPNRARVRPRGAITVAAGPAIGLVPKVAGWLGGDVALHLGRARIGATVGHAFARSTGDDSDVGASVRLTSGGLLGCFVPSWRRVALAACGLAELGAMHARGTGPGVAPTSQRALWVGLGLRSGVEWSPVPWVALVAQVDVLAVARRPGFHVARAGEVQRVFRAAPAALRLSAGLSFRFP